MLNFDAQRAGTLKLHTAYCLALITGFCLTSTSCGYVYMISLSDVY